jgi:hypothetical protein
VGGTGQSALAERWNGTTWTVQQLPPLNLPPSNQFEAVSCPSSTDCFALGFADDLFAALIEHWNGTSWTVQTTPPNVYPNTLSCPTATACMAAGSSSQSTGVTETWDGTSWTLTAASQPSMSNFGGLSCVSLTDCTVVGSNFKANSLTAAIEHWDGSGWSGQKPPSPVLPDGFQCTGACTVRSSHLSGVDCLSARACTAVGGSEVVTAVPLFSLTEDPSLTIGRNGNNWTAQASPNLGTLYGASCTAPNACTAVGQDVPNALGIVSAVAERWDGAAWINETTPTIRGARAAVLQSVSCTSAKACTAVGWWSAGFETFTLAEAWNGSRWAIEPTPD